MTAKTVPMIEHQGWRRERKREKRPTERERDRRNENKEREKQRETEESQRYRELKTGIEREKTDKERKK